MKKMEAQLDILLKCKSFKEAKKTYNNKQKIELIKAYMKSDPLDYEAEVEKKVEECNEASKIN